MIQKYILKKFYFKISLNLKFSQRYHKIKETIYSLPFFFLQFSFILFHQFDSFK